MYATVSITTALLHREKTGEGQDIELSLFDTVMTWTGYFPYMYWYQGRAPGRVGVNHHTMFPYGLYLAGDGKGVVIAAGAGSRDQWLRFCTAIDRLDLVDHAEYATNDLRLSNMAVLQEIVERVFAEHDQQYWLDRFLDYGIPAGAYREFEDAMEHPLLAHRGLVKEVDSTVGPVKVLDFPSQFSTLDIVNRLGPPALGEHTDAVLRSAGISDERVAELRQAGIIG
jgi:formyl-CoA transferase